MSGELLRLGSGRLSGAGVSAKAARLDVARGHGLPVPDGVVVVDGMDETEAASHVAAMFDRTLAVRSAFSAEDRSGQSMAGHFDTLLDVAPNADAIQTAIETVRASGGTDIRRDVLIMPMIEARHAGVAFSESGWQSDIVNVVEGQGEQLVSGAEAGERLELARLRRWERPTVTLAWQRRLQVILRDTRLAEGDEPWDIEWADDGTTCWFLQIRPITAPITRDEIYTLANHREILPDPPSVFMSSVIISNGRRLKGPAGLLTEAIERRGYFEMFDGRPYINHSVGADLVRSLGLPSSLVSDSLGGDDVDAVPLNPLRLVLSAPDIARLAFHQARAVKRSARVAARLRQPATAPATFEEATAAFAEAHLALAEEMGNLVSAMALPLALLRRLGVLSEHFSGLETPGTRIMSDLREMMWIVDEVPGGVEVLENGELPDHPAVKRAWQGWLEDHGHRGRFESDLSQARFSEDHGQTLRLAATLSAPSLSRLHDQGLSPREASSWKRTLTTPLWIVGRRALVAREELRSQAMRGFQIHRRAILALAQQAVADGRLPEIEAIWDLEVDELIALDGGEVVSTTWLVERRAQIAAHAAIDAPEVRRRFGAIDLGAEPDGSGVPLFPGVVRGRAWVLDTPSTEPPLEFVAAETILVARSVDAGWVPTFGLVAGVAVDIGGDLSHGSIILRELALPSITNTRGMTKQISTGDHVELDASTGRISPI